VVKKNRVVAFTLNPVTAKQSIIAIASDTDKIIFTGHALKRMRQRKVSRAQVLKCLIHGFVSENPHMDIKGSWKLNITTVTAGQPLTVTAVLGKDSSGDNVIIITVFR